MRQILQESKLLTIGSVNCIVYEPHWFVERKCAMKQRAGLWERSLEGAADRLWMAGGGLRTRTTIHGVSLMAWPAVGIMAISRLISPDRWRDRLADRAVRRSQR